ncbi:cell division protein ZapE [uncultured Shewanella sp.]|uniref:cell division protein ZapE n=1 Tax=uncultured Shewanella sp. TaxID=173975 RepID=UPI0026204A14|nr:cell division protein ZapE [uncultured Shewanella sp.]
MTTDLLHFYRAKIVQSQSNELTSSSQVFVDDPDQNQALTTLNQLFIQLNKQQGAEPISETEQPTNQSPQTLGVYLWGDVGRGKTFLMDMFYSYLNTNRKLRLHFHRFMAEVHQQLNTAKGISDPLVHIAHLYADKYQVICFDEFFVSDIGDAIILGRLFEHIFNQGVILVATSNIEVNRLYEGGLQRERFLPFIELLTKKVHQVELKGLTDHRINQQSITPLSVQLSLQPLMKQQSFIELAGLYYPHEAAVCTTHDTIIICNRAIEYQARVNKLIWFNFKDLCDGPRSQLDYIEIASLFEHVVIDKVPQLGGEVRTWIKARGTEDAAIGNKTGERQLSYATNDDPARRFISLVDELYDQKVSLTVCSSFNINQLYSGGALSFEFRRTISRLIEMKRWNKALK